MVAGTSCKTVITAGSLPDTVPLVKPPMRRRENISKVALGASSGINAECWVEDHGDCLYRYALLRVRRPEVAEDLVQERRNGDGADLPGLENFAE